MGRGWHVFLAGAVDQGIGSFFHFYAGYLNTVPRIGALIAAALPLSIAPLVIATYAVVTPASAGPRSKHSVALTFRTLDPDGAWALFRLPASDPRREHREHGKLAVLTCCSVVLAAAGIPRTEVGRGLSVVFLVATAASTIVGFVLFPVALLRLLDRRSRIPAVIFLAVQTLHGIVIVIVKPKRHIGIPASLHDVAHTFVYDVLASQFFGGPLATSGTDAWFC